jgi:tricorn protease
MTALTRAILLFLLIIPIPLGAATPGSPIRPHSFPQVSIHVSNEAMAYSPTLSRTQIAFVAAGQLWVVDRRGGLARPVGVPMNPMGNPRFSPDGTRIAYAFGHVGSFRDVYTVSVSGGTSERVTYQPDTYKIPFEWTRDRHLIYASPADFVGSGREMFSVPAKGGLPVKLPLLGTEAALSEDGRKLAFTNSMRIPSWKRYQGGMAQDIWIYDTSRGTTKRITQWSGTDCNPMWVKNRLFYLSDAGPERRLNVWEYDEGKGTRRQITRFADYDIESASPGPGPDGRGEIVFQCAGDIYLMKLEGTPPTRVPISLPNEVATLAARTVDAAQFINTLSIAPSGDSLAVEARGDIWLLKPTGGAPVNLTHTDGVCERDPAVSPDGKRVAYFSDATREYDLYEYGLDSNSAPRKIAALGPGFRYTPTWSPDASHIAFTDHAGAILLCSVASGSVRKLGKDTLSVQTQVRWSPDSRFLVYHTNLPTGLRALWAYDLQSAHTSRLTSGMTRDSFPVFGTGRGQLYFVSSRDFTSPAQDAIDRGFAYRNPSVIVSAKLPANLGTSATVEFERSETVLPIPPGRFSNLSVAPDGRLTYARVSDTAPPTLCVFDPATGREERILPGIDDIQMSAGGRLLVVADGAFRVLSMTGSGPLLPGTPVSTTGMQTTVMPTAEWRQMFADQWRFFRDYFYSPGMHGVNWPAQRAKYARLLPKCRVRADLDFVIGQMVGEMNASHNGLDRQGDEVAGPQGTPAVGYLGVDFRVSQGAYQIARIVQGSPWDASGRGPLSHPGLGVKSGDYLLAVNGVPLDVRQAPYAAFLGLANRTVTLTVSKRPVLDSSARQVTVQTMGSERDLRYRAWSEANRLLVAQRSGGRVGYLHVPGFGTGDLGVFIRQFYGQTDREALIVDARWNDGGQHSDAVIEMLQRPVLDYLVRRHSIPMSIPQRGHHGPKCLLINHQTASSGESFAYYFRAAGIGKVLGSRTRGMLTGNEGAPQLLDGGVFRIPQFGTFGPDGRWLPEGHGVEPDLPVEENPAAIVPGKDDQLTTAVNLMLTELREHPPRGVRVPPAPVPPVR